MTGSSAVQCRRGYANTMKLLPVILAVLATPAFPMAQAPAPAPAPAARPSAEAKDPLEDCSAHKFETVVERVVDGEPRQSRVRLCGQQGQSDSDWIVTLEDAIAKLRANPDMAAETRNQVIAALEREIARLRNPAAGNAAASAPTLTPRAAPRPRDFRDDYASLPQIPPPAPAEPIAPPLATLSEPAPDVRSTPPASGPSDQASTQPTKPVVARPMIATAPVAAPSLEFACYVPGDIAAPAPCIDFQRDTLITVRAKSDVPVGTQLHFERNGTDRASIAIGPLKSGRAVRVPLPNAVCAGVGDGRLSIAVWNGSRPTRTEGPFALRCT
ncbi:MAG: hypothetical protein ABIS39_08010 [Sphingomicrobium sp.]